MSRRIAHFAYHYRRRYLDMTTGISVTSGPALVTLAEPQLLVVDMQLPNISFGGSVRGRRGTTIDWTPVGPARLFLWPQRHLRLLQFFDLEGRCTVHRVDFATPAHARSGSYYQTDLYLDLFASGDAADYAVLDEDELEEALARGLIEAPLAEAVTAQAAALIELLEAGTFAGWLGELCPLPFAVAATPGGRVHNHREYAVGEPDGWPLS